jgi:transposase-like protein
MGKNPAWPKWTPEQEQRAIDLYLSGMPIAAIGREMGRNEKTINQKLIRMGIRRNRVYLNRETEKTQREIDIEACCAHFDDLVREHEEPWPFLQIAQTKLPFRFVGAA